MGMNYKRSGDIIEIVIRDGSFAKIESRKANMQDENSARELAYWLYEKYGYKLEVPIHGKTKADFFDW